MKWREYVCQKAFEFVFADLGEPKEYGFNSFEEMYDDFISENKYQLIKADGVETDVAEEYWGRDINACLENRYDDFKYIVFGVFENDVDIDFNK